MLIRIWSDREETCSVGQPQAGGGDAKSTIKRAALNGEKAKYVAKETETWEKDNKHFIEKANQKRKEMDDFIQQKKSDPKEFFADFGTAGDMEEAAKKYAEEKKQRCKLIDKRFKFRQFI